MRLESATSTPIACEVAAARLIRTDSPNNGDDPIVGMWKTSLKKTRDKSSYPFSIWESNVLVLLTLLCVLVPAVEVRGMARLFRDRGHYSCFRMGNSALFAQSGM